MSFSFCKWVKLEKKSKLNTFRSVKNYFILFCDTKFASWLLKKRVLKKTNLVKPISKNTVDAWNPNIRKQNYAKIQMHRNVVFGHLLWLVNQMLCIHIWLKLKTAFGCTICHLEIGRCLNCEQSRDQTEGTHSKFELVWILVIHCK